MIWKTINGFPNYEASNTGLIRSKRGIISQRLNRKTGYKLVTIWHEKMVTRSVHRLIGLTFLPNPEGLPCVCHRNNDKTDNNISNLKWGSLSDNMKDKLKFNTQFYGPLHPMAKLTSFQMIEIFKLRNSKIKKVEIARRYGVTSSHVVQIQSGKRCSRITKGN